MIRRKSKRLSPNLMIGLKNLLGIRDVSVGCLSLLLVCHVSPKERLAAAIFFG
jgi:hypothetical protein